MVDERGKKDLLIEVDGGVNKEIVLLVIEVGVNLFVVGLVVYG